MNLQGIVSVIALVFGVVVIVVLCAIGGVVKQTVHDGITSRLEYELPDGYKQSDTYQECYRSTKGKFWEEYYVWNLTNLADTINGATPNFNLTGPYTYTLWYCQYDHSIDKEAGLLKYRTLYDGYMFLEKDSVTTDDVKITNVNPAYLGLLGKLQGSDENLLHVMAGSAVEKIIETFQLSSTQLQVQLTVLPSILSGTNSKMLAVALSTYITSIFSAASVTETQMFTPGFEFSAIPLQGWTTYVLSVSSSANVTLSTSTQATIFTAWSSTNTLITFLSTTAAALATTYDIEEAQATNMLAYFNNHLFVNPAVLGVGIPARNAQWANGTSSTSLSPGWEIGLPTASGLSANDVTLLFDTTSSCSITSSTGIRLWIGMIQKSITDPNSVTGCSGYTLSAQQTQLVQKYLTTYASTVVANYLLYNVYASKMSSWDDFAWAQWGGLLLGSTLGTTYAYEIAAYTGYKAHSPFLSDSCVQFSISQSKTLLNGTLGVFNYTNMVGLLSNILAASLLPPFDALTRLDEIGSVYGISGQQVACFGYYIQDIIEAYPVKTAISQLDAAGGGLFTTRTVREWLMTAEDPLLAALGNDPRVALVGNTTVNQTTANTLNYTYVRIFTGKNDLHWSLMPFRDGERLDFWRGDVRVTGYNGSQFLPYGYLDSDFKEHPLELWNIKINRSIPFVIGGKDTWDGVNVRYLQMDPKALLSQYENPDNYPFYSEYGGVINKTSNPPYLPVFLSTPNFLSAEKAFTANLTFTDHIFTDYVTEKMSRHRLSLFVLAEPDLGTALWGNLPIQLNFKYGPTYLNPNVKPSFAPIFWNAIGNIATSDDLDEIKNVLYAGQRAWKILIGVGVGVGVLCMIGGIVGIHHYKKHKDELLDTPTTTTVSSSN